MEDVALFNCGGETEESLLPDRNRKQALRFLLICCIKIKQDDEKPYMRKKNGAYEVRRIGKKYGRNKPPAS